MTLFNTMRLLVDQPCFVESKDQEMVIAAARVVEVSDNGGALYCESGENISSDTYPAVLVALHGHQVQRVPIILSAADRQSPIIAFSTAVQVSSSGSFQ
jgi:hypothetical protein